MTDQRIGIIILTARRIKLVAPSFVLACGLSNRATKVQDVCAGGFRRRGWLRWRRRLSAQRELGDVGSCLICRVILGVARRRQQRLLQYCRLYADAVGTLGWHGWVLPLDSAQQPQR